MNRIFPFFFSFLIFLSFTSCFEITEEVDMKANGSGILKLTVNLSESKDNLANFMKQGEVEGVKLPSRQEIEQYLTKVQTLLSNVNGITNVQMERDFSEFIFTLSGNFDQVETLNKAINTLADQLNQSPYPSFKATNFSFVNNTFARRFEYPIDADGYKKLGAMERFVLETARLVSIYRFEQRVKKYTNRNARLSPTKKAIMMSHTIGAIAKGDATIENQIEF